MNKMKLLVAAGLLVAVASTAAVSFAARPENAGKPANVGKPADIVEKQYQVHYKNAERAINHAEWLLAKAVDYGFVDDNTVSGLIESAKQTLEEDPKLAKQYANQAKDILSDWIDAYEAALEAEEEEEEELEIVE
jgi:hypothetical protein